MKIAIIGGGWVGCHLASKLKKQHEVTIFDKNSKLFTQTSYNNQNRLHLGYHYARSYETRELCHITFDRFIDDYGFAVKDVDKNLYCVASNKSIIDYRTYLKIFEDYDYQVINHNFNSFEGCINTNEKYIDYKKMYNHFNTELDHIQMNVTRDLIKELQSEYDLVINATNNHISDKNIKNTFYEISLSLVYKKKKETDFDSVTVVDGNLFSIYPYTEDLFTVTDVEHTPLKKFKKVKDLENFMDDEFSLSLVEEKQKLIEEKIKYYYPNFLNDFEYHSFFTSTKSKMEGSSDSRYPIINKEGNLINCFTGKIQGIYLIEDSVNEFISQLSHG